MFDVDMGGCDIHLSAYDGRPSWTKVIVRLMILYVVTGMICWTEWKFSSSSVEVNATIDSVRTDSHTGKSRVHYWFHDPETGERRGNTVYVRAENLSTENSALIQYIRGEYPRSRLKIQAHPGMITVFLWINIILTAGVLGYVGYLSWEFHHDPLGHLAPKERAIERYKRRRQVEREWRGV